MSEPDLFVLKTNDLTVHIAPSGSRYSRSRFDTSGQVLQVQLHLPGRPPATFCGSDTRSEPESCGAFGLMNEFMPSDQGTYEAAVPGEGTFMKMGVGVLRRDTAQPYSQKHPYPVVQPVQLQEEAAACIYTTTLRQPHFYGFAYTLQKTLAVQGRQLAVGYTLHNTGSKTLCFGEYNHNFYRLGQESQTWHCVLECSFPAALQNPQGPIQQQGSQIKFMPFSGVCAAGLLSQPLQLQSHAPGSSVAVTNLQNGLCVQETLSCKPQRCFLWALPDVLCPELIVEKTVLPGQTAQWARTYTFSCQAESSYKCL